jgi:hypothetical protein
MIYQHEARGADRAITTAIGTHVLSEQTKRGDDEDGSAGILVPAGQWPGRYLMTLYWSGQVSRRGS